MWLKNVKSGRSVDQESIHPQLDFHCYLSVLLERLQSVIILDGDFCWKSPELQNLDLKDLDSENLESKGLEV